MTNSLVRVTSAAAFLAAVLYAAPAIAQEPVQQEPAQAEPAAATPAADATPAPQSVTVSPGVRIVRLSQAVGDVKLDRMTGHGFESAFANLPIVQGAKLRTGDGVAEVEFEDSSSLRLTPNSEVEFPVLSMNGSGVRNSTVHVVQGTIYASMTKNPNNNVSLTFGKETLALSPAAHIELAVNGNQPRLDVMDGTVQAMNGTTTTEVGKKKALLFDTAGTNAPTLVSKNEKGPYAEWDKNAAEYHSRMAPSGNSYAGTPYTYGLADMNYYGSFVPMGGCGMMWQPYLVSTNWSPFSNGVWAWYPSAGYSWVSPYPWGWTAFHSGSWNYCPGSGWGWQPSNSWNGLQNSPATTLVKQPGRLNMKPPVAHPRPVGPTMIAVNEKPLVVSKLNQDTFTFRKDSAGFGVPRGTFGKLNHISSDVMHHGSVERQVYVPSAPNSGVAGHGMQGNGSLAMNEGGRNVHTMPASGSGSGSMHTSPSSGSMGGGHASSGSMGGGSIGGGGHMGGGGSVGGGSMGGGMAGGGAASSGGHH